MVAFANPSLDAGSALSFQADTTLKGKNPAFPVASAMESKDQNGDSVSFAPAEAPFPDAAMVVTTTVTVTLEADPYGAKPRVKTTVKARPKTDHGLGKEAGIRVVVLCRPDARAASIPKRRRPLARGARLPKDAPTKEALFARWDTLGRSRRIALFMQALSLGWAGAPTAQPQGVHSYPKPNPSFPEPPRTPGIGR
ncbi:MAG: hypothetical protein WBS54_14970 [Acidobacteriota bacterium]